MVFNRIATHHHERVFLHSEIGRHTRRIRKKDRVALYSESDVVSVIIKPYSLKILFCLKILLYDFFLPVIATLSACHKKQDKTNQQEKY